MFAQNAAFMSGTVLLSIHIAQIYVVHFSRILLVFGCKAPPLGFALAVNIHSMEIWFLHFGRVLLMSYRNVAVVILAVVFTIYGTQSGRLRTLVRTELTQRVNLLETRLLFTRFRWLSHPIIEMKECRIFASPGFLNFQGGVFNPGAILNGGKIIVCAKSQEMHWSNAIESKKFELYMKGKPILMEFDHDLRLEGASEIQTFKHLPEDDDIGIEDFRMFKFKDKIYINHALCYKLGEGGYLRAKQCLSSLDLEKKEITYLGEPDVDFPVSAIEKNWSYFEHESELYLLYSLSPYVLLKATRWPELSFETVIRREIDTNQFQEEVFPTVLSLSTNAIDYDADHLLVIVHKFVIIEHRMYAHWAVLLDKESLLPVKISSRPFICGGNARGMFPGIVYTTAVVDCGDSVIVFNGESDLQCSYAKISKKRLDSCWVDLAFENEERKIPLTLAT